MTDATSSEGLDSTAILEMESMILAHRDTGRKFGRTVLRRWGAQMSEDDFDSAVDLAICEAAKSYCPDQGASFSTFLFYYVRGSLIKVIKSSVTAKKAVRAVMHSVAGNELTRLEKEGEQDAESAIQNLGLVDQQEYESPEERALRLERIRLIRECMDRLGENERKVLQALFHDGRTPNDMAREYGWSRQYVARLKVQAIRQLKELFDVAVGDQKAANQTQVKDAAPSRRGKMLARRRRMVNLHYQRPVATGYRVSLR